LVRQGKLPEGGLSPSRDHRRFRAKDRQAGCDLRHEEVFNERVWAKAVHRVAADGISPEQAVDGAIARIKQILSE
jgi:hypothetical protein